MDNIFVIWIIAMVVALSLDVLLYIVLRRGWEKHGVLITETLFKQVSDRLGQVVKTWQKPAPVKTKPPVPAQKPVEPAQAKVEVKKEQAQPVQAAVESELIPASVQTVGQLKRVQFSMDVPLDSAIDISIASTPEAGVKVRKRQAK
jgi:hypothetical protein